MSVKEQNLINCINAKDWNGALNTIVHLYHELMYWHIRKLVICHDDADDVLQNTYLKMVKGLPGFKQKSSVKTWIYRIAYNESMRFLKKQRQGGVRLAEKVTDSYFAKLESDPYIDTNACDKKLHQALALLTPQKRHIVQMKYFDDLTFDEIAIITDININTVKASYYSAKKSIETQLLKDV